MERWIGRVAVVTGASSGIGASIAVELVKAGMIVIGAARRQERVDDLKNDIPEVKQKNLQSFKCDVSKEEDIKALIKWVDEKFGGVDVLINNAGVATPGNLLAAGNTDILNHVIQTNFTGAAICCREAFESMKKKGVDGHIILLNSVGGHIVPHMVGFPSYNVYMPSKHAITAMTEVLRQELQALKTKIKVTSISPGVVKTEMTGTALADFPHLNAIDIANGVLYVLGTPPHVQVHELTIRPIGEQF